MGEGGKILDYHSSEMFPERWIDHVYVLRAKTEILFDRLTARYAIIVCFLFFQSGILNFYAVARLNNSEINLRIFQERMSLIFCVHAHYYDSSDVCH